MTKFIAFVSGKGGVGKTTVTLNTGLALGKLGKKVVLLDANVGTPNLSLHLGIMNPEHTLNQFLRKEKNLQQITYMGDENISFLFSSPSYAEYQKTNFKKFSEIFEHLDHQSDFVLVDSPSGLGPEVNQVLKNTDEAIIVVNPNLSSVMDALKTIQLAAANKNIITGIVLNMSNFGGWNELKPQEIEEILGYPIIANIKHNSKFRKAAHKQNPLTTLYPRSASVREFKKIASNLALEGMR